MTSSVHVPNVADRNATKKPSTWRNICSTLHFHLNVAKQNPAEHPRCQINLRVECWCFHYSIVPDQIGTPLNCLFRHQKKSTNTAVLRVTALTMKIDCPQRWKAGPFQSMRANMNRLNLCATAAPDSMGSAISILSGKCSCKHRNPHPVGYFKMVEGPKVHTKTGYIHIHLLHTQC